jgi:hypothetical protein
MQLLDGFKLDNINNSNFPLRTFRCGERVKPIFKMTLETLGWKIISERRSTLYGDIIIKAAKRTFIKSLSPRERERHGITNTAQSLNFISANKRM